MSILEAIVCGAVQGACEFLPVSSSGHLALLHGLFGFDASGGNVLFDVLLHLGTLAAVMIAFSRDVFALICAYFSLIAKLFSKRRRRAGISGVERVALMMIVSSAPLVFAVFIKDAAEALSNMPRVVGAIMILNGIMLLFSSRFDGGDGRCEQLGASQSLGIGLFQLAATLPGISRSGSTIVGGTLFGLSREESVRYSFLLSVPAIIGANVFSAADAVKSGVKVDVLPCAIGTVTAATVGVLAIWLIRKIARSRNFNIFGIYCILAGTAALVLA
ncbi:MAG: undecaprenyl-diphosphate phosphatase [Clostridia bacterium]|nr:undecaprenyl-diphosphate phosphatase [Clostridia bacterium]